MIHIRPHIGADHFRAPSRTSASPTLTPRPAAVTGRRSYDASRKTRGGA